jgi:tetratricopeptide (TPR) repeat protein
VFTGIRQRGALAAAAAVVVALAIPAYLSTTAVARAGTEAATSSEDALTELDSAARLNPFSTEPLLHRSIILQLDGNPRAALDAARDATERAPRYWAAWVVRAQSARAAGEPSEARAARLRAKALNPRALQLQGR